MKIRDLAKLSTRMFQARTSRTLLTVLGMGVGVGAILFLVSLGYGIQKSLLETITTTDSLLSLDIYPGRKEDFIRASSIDEVKNIPGVAEISPVYDIGVQAKYQGINADSRAYAVDSRFMQLNGTKISQGEGISDNNSLGIVVSPTFVRLLGKEEREIIGEEIRLSLKYAENSEKEKKSRVIELPDSYKIIGLLDSKDNSIFLNISSLSGNVSINSYSRLKVKCASSQELGIVREKLSQSGFVVSALSDVVKQADQVFKIVRIILGFFGMIALLVSAIGMFNTMTVTLLERTEEIGIMKSIGASDSDILLMFVFESTVMGFLGGISGIIIGLAGGKIFNLLINLVARAMGGAPVNLFFFPLWFLAFILFSGTLVGFLTGIIPARRASRTDPLDALRYK